MDNLIQSLKRFLFAFGLRRQAGISLVELLISVAMLGGVALTVAELMRQSGQVTSKTRTRYDESEFLTILHSKLMQPDVCEKNFPVGSAAAKASFTNDELLDVDNSVLAKVGDQYGENQDLTLSAISSSYEATSSWIKVNFQFTKAKTSNLAPQAITRSLLIFAEVDTATGNVERCLGSSLSVEDSLWDLACTANTLAGNSRDVMVVVEDPDNAGQNICVKKNLNPEGCGLLATEVANTFGYNSSTKLYDFTCVNALNAAVCPMDFFMRYRSDGTAVCLPISQLQSYQPFNETDDLGAFVSGPAVLPCTGRYYSGLQDINNRIRVLCDNVVADTPTPTPTPTETNTPTATPTTGSCRSCATRPATYTYRINKSDIPDNATTHFGVYLVNDCDGQPTYPGLSGFGVCSGTGCSKCTGLEGPICGVNITNSSGSGGTYTIFGTNGGSDETTYTSLIEGVLGVTTQALACNDNPIWSGAVADGLTINLAIHLYEFTSPMAAADPSLLCYLMVGATVEGLWTTNFGGYSVESPSVYTGINGANWSCLSPD
jgi:hypothetical protein